VNFGQRGWHGPEQREERGGETADLDCESSDKMKTTPLRARATAFIEGMKDERSS
jgi:hypothetical protein